MPSLPTASITESLLGKVEIGFAHYLSHAVPSFGLTWRTALHGGPAPAEFPLLLFTATNQRHHPDLPYTAGTYFVDLTLTLYWTAPDAHHQERPYNLDQALYELGGAMFDLSAAQAFLNLQESGVDSRPLCSFHVHDIGRIPGSPPTTDLSQWIESIAYTVTVVDADTTFAAAVTTAAYLTLGGNRITLGGNYITLAS